jgi:hypothetical protein
MERQHWTPPFFYSFLVGVIIMFVVSCGERPTPGPISPINLTGRGSWSKQMPSQSGTNTVRPVKRLDSSAFRALAKSGYNPDKVLQELLAVIDELTAIVKSNPGTAVADKLEDVAAKTQTAMQELQKTPSDDPAALGNIQGAKGDLGAAIKDKLLNAYHGGQLMSELTAIETQIQAGFSPADDCRGNSKALWIKRTYGGLIKFCGHSVAVPKYATKRDAEFSINISPNDYITVNFGPDGWFDQEVTVTISYQDADLTGIEPSTLTLAWYDESNGQWVDLGGVVDVVNKTVTAKAWHFTQYTLSKR